MTQRVLPTTYDPVAVEEKWMAHWQEQGYYHAEVRPGAPRFCITIPPPNVTGELHMGHALQHAIHDAVIRWQRMLGKETLCVPGTDHAGIATQMKVERQIAAEGLTKYDLGREAFLERMWQWKEHYGGAILRQLKRFGASYDWRRERFTLDPGYTKAVRTAFVHLYNKGLVYRGVRIINWCPSCETAISDLEVEHEERQGKLWHFKYPFADEDGGIIVATTRPETMLGDTAVAVNPEDPRYSHLVGKTVVLPLMNRPIPIIADTYVDPSFGTGAVKVTPAHDPNDAEMGRRHDLPAPIVIGKNGTMTEDAGNYVGLDRYEARAAVLADLEKLGLLVEAKEHTHAVGACARCASTIEPLLSEQWFVEMRPLAQHVLDAIREERVAYQPERFAQYSIEWLENVRDWCISRQLWWGHRIPVYTCGACGHEFAAIETPEQCPRCNDPALEQDPDVLDTWFSSALWPFAVLGWPDQTPELDYFYPTDLMITGRDILYLWIARMIYSGMEYLEGPLEQRIPYYRVLIHPTVQNFEGKRMSKSLGTGVDPLELMEKYGTDATRFGLCGMATATQDVRLQEAREPDWNPEKPDEKRSFPFFVQGRNFATKIWNASRFALMNLEADTQAAPVGRALADRWILARLNTAIENVTASLENYRLDQATQTLYDFFWSEFCDWYLEMIKPTLRGDDQALASDTRATLAYVLENALRLLHPFMPFITEEIWRQLPHAADARESIMTSPWPVVDTALADTAAECDIALLMDLVGAVRKLRADQGVSPAQKVAIRVACEISEVRQFITRNEAILLTLTRGEEVTVSAAPLEEAGEHLFWQEQPIVLSISREMSAEERQKEAEKLRRDLEKLLAEIEKMEARLANPQFAERAPEAVVAKARADLAELRHRQTTLEERLRSME
ncbi:MAG: Valine--tRNA ligase [bacterium ADurb.Bin429]|nr:MAG: Valine--tRNA ligase [bacterium ADurb.Bin429]